MDKLDTKHRLELLLPEWDLGREEGNTASFTHVCAGVCPLAHQDALDNGQPKQPDGCGENEHTPHKVLQEKLGCIRGGGRGRVLGRVRVVREGVRGMRE